MTSKQEALQILTVAYRNAATSLAPMASIAQDRVYKAIKYLQREEAL